MGYMERDANEDDDLSSMVYYREALKYAPTLNDEVRTLRRIAKKQYKTDFDGYVDTKLSIIKMSEGRRKIMEMIRLAKDDRVDNKLKVKLYEGAANELIEDKYMPKDEKRLLWKNVRSSLSELYGNNSRKNARLQTISDKYFPDAKPKKKVGLSKRSSSGKDYFSR